MMQLQQLEAKIRQALPRLKELSDGCYFRTELGSEFKIVYRNESLCSCIQKDKFDSVTFLTDYISKLTIIGHNIYLSDVLEWLGTIKYHMINIEGKINESHKVRCTWDLSKPLLKDQPKEVIEYLNNLK